MTFPRLIPTFGLLIILLFPACAASRTMVERTDSVMPEDSVVADTLDLPINADEPLPERLRCLLENEIFERTQVGLCVWDLTADTLVFAHGERQCLRPASNEKLVTAITALHTLGTGYLFRTRLYADTLQADSTFAGRVYVEAGYDPLLDPEDLRAFADSLVARGIRRITSPVCLDLSFKDGKRMGWGWCWDDDEVPLTPLLCSNKDRFREQLRRAFAEAGIEWDGATEERPVPEALRSVCERTHTIDQILLPMMKSSDNSMAEALFYQIAHHGGHRHAGRKQAVSCVNALIRQVGLDPGHYQIADGSGLSLYNYLTPQLLVRLLRFAYADKKIYAHLLPSLPVAGEDGTLRKRLRGTPAAGNVQAKTGTVEGVSTLSGYLTTAKGNRLCFSIMNQGIRHTSTGRNFQDRVCKALCR